MTLPTRFESPYAIVGTPTYWALKAAQLGATLPLATAGTTFGLLALFRAQHLADLAVSLGILGAIGAGCGAAVGGALGWMAPSWMEGARGRISLWLLAPSQSTVGAAAGGVAGALTVVIGSLLFGGPVSLSGVQLLFTIGAGLGALAAPLWWLPFTVATVTGRRWPVTTLVGALTPALLLALRLFVAM